MIAVRDASKTRRRSQDPQQVTFTFDAPQLVPQGDGSIRIIPGKVVSELTPLQFGRQHGCSRSAVYNFMSNGTIPENLWRRVTPRKLLIRAEALTVVKEKMAPLNK